MKAIVAMDPNRVIGCKGEIPWHISEDFKWFKRVTMGIPYQRAVNISEKVNVPVPERGQHKTMVVVGRKTYDKVGILPGRYHFVLTHNSEKLALPATDVCRYATYEDILAANSPYMWVIGGANVYELLMPYVDEIFVTHVIDEYDGDAFMPSFEDRFPEQELLRETKDYSIVRYSKPYCLYDRRTLPQV